MEVILWMSLFVQLPMPLRLVLQNIGGKAVIIYTNCSKLATNRTIYLKFDYYPGNSQNNHYSAIIEDTCTKPTGNERDVNPDETGYEPIAGDVLEEFIQEKNQRTKSKISKEKEDRIKWICHY